MRIRLLGAAVVVVLATITGLALAASGDLDPTFSGDGIATAFNTNATTSSRDVALQPDGKVVVVGTEGNDFAVARFNADGTPDTGFSGDGMVKLDFGGSDAANAVAIQTDGKIVVGGGGTIADDFTIARFNADGTPDNGFSEDGKETTNMGFSDTIDDLAVQPDGKIVAAGAAANKFGVARYAADGTLDTSLNPCPGEGSACGGKIVDPDGQNSLIDGIALQPDGKIVAVGSEANELWLARYTTGGAQDTTFNPCPSGQTQQCSGFQHTDFGVLAGAGDVVVLVDGSILVGGSLDRDLALVRYTSAGIPDTGFSGDGKVTTDFGGDDAGRGIAIDAAGRIVLAGAASATKVALARYTATGDLDTAFSGDGKQIGDTGSESSATGLAVQADGKPLVSLRGVGIFGAARFQVVDGGVVATPSTSPVGTPTPTVSPTATPTPKPTKPRKKGGACSSKKGKARSKCIKKKCKGKKGSKRKKCVKKVTRKPS